MGELSCGPVRVLEGKYKNMTGYYECDCGGGRSVVYLKGAPGFPNAECIKVPRSYLDPIDNTLELARLARKHPEVVKILGIRTRR